jgi:hypothetical protein
MLRANIPALPRGNGRLFKFHKTFPSKQEGIDFFNAEKRKEMHLFVGNNNGNVKNYLCKEAAKGCLKAFRLRPSSLNGKDLEYCSEETVRT